MVAEESVMFSGPGREIQAMSLKKGDSVVGLRGAIPFPLAVRSTTTRHVDDAVSITAGGKCLTTVPDTRLLATGLWEKVRAGNVEVDTDVRIFEDIAHLGRVECVERLDGGVRMVELVLEGNASCVICNGFLVRL